MLSIIEQFRLKYTHHFFDNVVPQNFIEEVLPMGRKLTWIDLDINSSRKINKSINLHKFVIPITMNTSCYYQM